MEFVFTEFKREIEQIRSHITFNENLKNDIKPESLNFQYSNSSSRKKYDYNSVIVSLYGILESYIEKIITSYLHSLEREIFTYNNLNNIIIESHFRQSISLINKISEGRYQKYNHIKKENVLDNLNNCIIGNKPYKINKEAFIINTGNLKHNKIAEILKNFDIKLNDEIKKQDGFNLESENLFNKLDELVDRRNEISHGAISIIMDNSEISPMVDFLENYFTAIKNLLFERKKNEVNLFKKANFSIALENTKIFDGNILGIFKGMGFGINPNSIIFIEKSENVIVLSSIQELKEFPESKDITIKLDKRLKEDYKYYIFDENSYMKELLGEL